MLLSCAHGPRAVRTELWLEVQSDHFVLLTDALPDGARFTVNRLERARSLMLRVMWRGGTTPSGRMRVIHFTRDSELSELARPNLAGMVVPDGFGGRLVVTTDTAEGLETVLYHELAHRLSVHFLPRQPRWISEGIAAYLETIHADWTGDRFLVGESNADRLSYLSGGVSNYEAVLDMDSSYLQASSERGYSFETHAWALVHWLINHDAAGFNRYLERVSRGEGSRKAFEETFPSLPVSSLDGIISTYVRGGRYKAFGIKLAPYTGTIEIRSVPRAEVFAQRALIRRAWHGANDSAYQEELAAALRADPAHPLALKLSGRVDGAAATSAHPEDVRAWLLRSSLAGGNLNLLEQAAQVAPEDPHVLADLALQQGKAGALSDGIANALRAVQFEPGRPDFLLGLAALLTDAGRCDEATLMGDRALEVLPDRISKDLVVEAKQAVAQIRTDCTPLIEPAVKSCSGDGPRLAAKDNVDAVVAATFEVGPDGSVADVNVSGTDSKPVLDAVRAFVKSCTFKPAMRAGKPVPRRIREQYQFGTQTKASGSSLPLH
jgi:hypothetical protein